jgi:prepilin-type N-terminal cleavage/methylation domain-containing protein
VTRNRRGFTLLEMSIVLAIMAIASGLVVPALVNFGQTPPRRTADALLSLLGAARKLAIDHDVIVILRLDPKSGTYRVDSTGLSGSGEVAEAQLDVLNMEAMSSDQDRLVFRFTPTGSAIADTLRLRSTDSSLVIKVDPWSGVAYAHGR